MKKLIVILLLLLAGCGNPVDTSKLDLVYDIPVNYKVDYTQDFTYSDNINLDLNGYYRVQIEFLCTSEKAVYSSFNLFETAKLFQCYEINKIGFNLKKNESGTYAYTLDVKGKGIFELKRIVIYKIY